MSAVSDLIEKIEKETERLEEIKTDLRWQLSFEEIDWDHFGESVKSAKVLRDKIKELKLTENRNDDLPECFGSSYDKGVSEWF